MSLAGSCFSTESAPGPFHHGIRGRGGTIFWAALPSEERQDQADSRTHLIHRPARDIFPLLGGTFGRPCRQKNGRTKRTHELTSSIVPRGTSFHCWVELWFSPVGFDPERFSCCCRGLLPGPPELGAVNPDAVHDHGQPASQGHDRLFHPAAPGDLHGPRLEPAPFF